MAGLFEVNNKVNLNTGEKTINLIGANFDASGFSSGVIVAIDNYQIVEAVSGTAPDINGDSTVVLRNNWSQSSVSNGSLIAFNSQEGLREAIANNKIIADKMVAITNRFSDLLQGTTPTITVDISATETITTVPYQYLVDQFNASQAELDNLVGSVQTTTKAEFFALAEQRKNQYAGSGFIEWGRSRGTKSSSWENVNQGLWLGVDEGALTFGTSNSTSFDGSSKSAYPIANVNGLEIHIDLVNRASDRSVITMPPAPDGLDKNDGTRYTDLAAAIVDGGLSLSKSVLTRQDLVFLEVWHEKISDKDIVFPFGNVQYGASSHDGITLSNSLVVQGYSAFGDWDTSTKGYGVKFSTLSASNKAKLIQDHRNNIYADNGELIQVRYRVRVIKGLGDTWNNIDPQFNQIMRYGTDDNTRVLPKGMRTATIDGTDIGSNAGVWYASSTYSNTTHQSGAFVGQGGMSTYSHNLELYCTPIALVQRRNKGGYDPTYNTEGTGKFNDPDAAGRITWYETMISRTVSNTSDCFDNVSAGSIDDDVTGRPYNKFHDAIYASDVKDLRMSARKVALSDLLTSYEQKAIAGELRGFEQVPFTRVELTNQTATWSVANNVFVADASKWSVGDLISIVHTNGTVLLANAKVNTVSTGGGTVGWDSTLYGTAPRVSGESLYIVHGSFIQTAKSDKPTWTDIIGDPARIAATFPNGVIGQWIPTIPDGTSKEFKMNKKNTLSAGTIIYTSNDGATYSSVVFSGVSGFDYIKNSRTWSIAANEVHLLQYETNANPYEIANNAGVLDIGTVSILAHHDVAAGAGLASNLIGKVITKNWGTYNGLGLSKYWIYNNKLSGSGSFKPKNETLPTINGTVGDYMTKAFPYITQENGQFYLQWLFKEMLWATDWGDDTFFTVANGVTTTTDDNGNKVRVGQKRVALPYFHSEV